eukprot:Hpha_TRINITY_DN9261_c0_g1::TRINITY_DN9261_c0_g1_i1::g.28610::m.28610/K08582/CAPN15; calpain-15
MQRKKSGMVTSPRDMACFGLPELGPVLNSPKQKSVRVEYDMEQRALKDELSRTEAAYKQYLKVGTKLSRRDELKRLPAQPAHRIGPHPVSPEPQIAAAVAKRPGSAGASRRLRELLDFQATSLQDGEASFGTYRRTLERPVSAPTREKLTPAVTPGHLPPPAARAWLLSRLEEAASRPPPPPEQTDAPDPEEEEEEEEEEESFSCASFDESEDEDIDKEAWAYGAWQEDWFTNMGARAVQAVMAEGEVKLSQRRVCAERRCPSLPAKGKCRRPGCGLPAEAARGLYCCERCSFGHGHSNDCTGKGLLNSKEWKWLRGSEGIELSGDDYIVDARGTGKAAVLVNVMIENGKQSWAITAMNSVHSIGLAVDSSVDTILQTKEWTGQCWWLDLEKGCGHQPSGRRQATSTRTGKPRVAVVHLDADAGTIRYTLDGIDSGVVLHGAVGTEEMLRPVVVLDQWGGCSVSHRSSSEAVHFRTKRSSIKKEKSREEDAFGAKVKEDYIEDIDEHGEAASDEEQDEWGDGCGSGAAAAALRWDGITYGLDSPEQPSKSYSSSEGVAFNVHNLDPQPLILVSLSVTLRDACPSLKVFSRRTPHLLSQSQARKISHAARVWRSCSEPLKAGKGDVRVTLCPPVLVPPGEIRGILLHCTGAGAVRLGDKEARATEDQSIHIQTASAVERDRSIQRKWRGAFTFTGSVSYALLADDQVEKYRAFDVVDYRRVFGSSSTLHTRTQTSSTEGSRGGWFNLSATTAGQPGSRFGKVRQLKGPSSDPIRRDHPVLGPESVPFDLALPRCSLDAVVMLRPEGGNGLWLIWDPDLFQVVAWCGRRRGWDAVRVTFQEGVVLQKGEDCEDPSLWPNLSGRMQPGTRKPKPAKKKAKRQAGVGPRGGDAPKDGRPNSGPATRPGSHEERRLSGPKRRHSEPRGEEDPDLTVTGKQVVALPPGFTVAIGVAPGETVVVASAAQALEAAPELVDVLVHTHPRPPDPLVSALADKMKQRSEAELRLLLGQVAVEGEQQHTRLVNEEALKRLLKDPAQKLLQRAGFPCEIIEEGSDSQAACSASASIKVRFVDGFEAEVTGACVVSKGDTDPADTALRTAVHSELLFVDPTFPPSTASVIGKGKAGKKVALRSDDPLAKPFAWMRPKDFCRDSEALLFVNEIAADDISQGSLGDCWLLCAISAAAEEDSLVHRLFVGSPEARKLGAYQLRLCHDGWWRKVIVDDYFPCDGPQAQAFASNRVEPHEVWAPLIEKAFAKLRGGYLKLRVGDPSDALCDITGYPTQRLNWKDSSAFSELVQGHREGFLITLSTPHQLHCGKSGMKGFPEESEYKEVGLNAGHAYTLLDAVSLPSGAQLVRLRNPWGDSRLWKGAWGRDSREWEENKEATQGLNQGTENDGTWYMEWGDVQKWFWGGTVCVVRPQWNEIRVATGFGKGGVPGHILEVQVDGLDTAEPIPCYIGIHQRDLPQDTDREHHAVRVSIAHQTAPDAGEWEIPSENGRSHDGTFASARDVFLFSSIQAGKRSLIVPRAAPGCKPFTAVLSVHLPPGRGTVVVRHPRPKLLRSIAAAKQGCAFAADSGLSPQQLTRVQLNRRCTTREVIDLSDMPPLD